MRPYILCLLLLLQSSFAYAFCAQDPDAMTVGTATDVKSGDPLYCEYHYAQGSEGERVLVEYRDPNQQIIARKQLDYGSGLLTPSVLQNDFRHNELRAISPLTENDKNAAVFNVQYRRANEDELGTADIIAAENSVIDAGFDQAVRQYWDSLIEGNKVIVDFISPVHLRAIKLKIRKSEGKRCQRHRVSLDQVCFLIQPANRLAALFVKPLTLVYAQSEQHLLTFVGSVNITNLEGSAFKAIIRYQYSG